ncbi:predicted protein [Plenodomus lingam JN3]|uniref:Predicted protein n=1 Tax=Leptosphaeria maculans (strain JN3 / isolate v23.1.3 / race Av1-4-5-6-7-8) TaxID=985895 RepID=E5A4A5_LEPMJ|nr:predicted protein [Plenodomus lingam JN3]CBX98450.1 predicted protein [Plenodomus lingam JN3]
MATCGRETKILLQDEAAFITAVIAHALGYGNNPGPLSEGLAWDHQFIACVSSSFPVTEAVQPRSICVHRFPHHFSGSPSLAIKLYNEVNAWRLGIRMTAGGFASHKPAKGSVAINYLVIRFPVESGDPLNSMSASCTCQLYFISRPVC